MKNVKQLVAGFVIGMVLAIAPSCGTAKNCSSSTCAAGCCDAKGECQLGTSNGACGQLGGACGVCQIAQACNLGTCSQTNGGGPGSGGGTGGGTTTGGGGGGVSGGGTGGGAGCDGCFFMGSCIIRANSNNNTICGQGGVTCAACTNGQNCANYVCTGGTGGGTAGGTGGGTAGGGGGTTGPQPVGGPCTSSGSCQIGLTCKTVTQRGDVTYPGGYCSKPCTTQTDCGLGNDCVGGAQSTLQFYGEANGFCVAECPNAQTQSTCRQGYTCDFAPAGQTGICWLNPIPPFNGGGPATNSGNPCTANGCQPSSMNPLLNICLKATLTDGGFSGYVGGYCTADCSYDNTGTATFCGTTATCVRLGAPPDDSFFCLQKCTTPGGRSNCRNPGYACFALRGADGGVSGTNICYADCVATGCPTGTCNTTTGVCQ